MKYFNRFFTLALLSSVSLCNAMIEETEDQKILSITRKCNNASEKDKLYFNQQIELLKNIKNIKLSEFDNETKQSLINTDYHDFNEIDKLLSQHNDLKIEENNNNINIFEFEENNNNNRNPLKIDFLSKEDLSEEGIRTSVAQSYGYGLNLLKLSNKQLLFLFEEHEKESLTEKSQSQKIIIKNQRDCLEQILGMRKYKDYEKEEQKQSARYQERAKERLAIYFMESKDPRFSQCKNIDDRIKMLDTLGLRSRSSMIEKLEKKEVKLPAIPAEFTYNLYLNFVDDAIYRTKLDGTPYNEFEEKNVSIDTTTPWQVINGDSFADKMSGGKINMLDNPAFKSPQGETLLPVKEIDNLINTSDKRIFKEDEVNKKDGFIKVMKQIKENIKEKGNEEAFFLLLELDDNRVQEPIAFVCKVPVPEEKIEQNNNNNRPIIDINEKEDIENNIHAGVLPLQIDEQKRLKSYKEYWDNFLPKMAESFREYNSYKKQGIIKTDHEILEILFGKLQKGQYPDLKTAKEKFLLLVNGNRPYAKLFNFSDKVSAYENYWKEFLPKMAESFRIYNSYAKNNTIKTDHEILELVFQKKFQEGQYPDLNTAKEKFLLLANVNRPYAKLFNPPKDVNDN